MSLDIFREVDNERIKHLSYYGTPPAIPHWDGWREITEDNYYCLKHDEERLMPDPPEAKGLYYYIGMDPNQVHLWKCTAAHIDAKVVLGPSTLLRTESAPHKSVTNIAINDVAMTMELGAVPDGNVGS
ncbi:hypothetical protein C0995_015585 [Termitomyces sp. Mi166|nr:hypothetical protein C0995_015585 [Termitomyces sp. Mi166\